MTLRTLNIPLMKQNIDTKGRAARGSVGVLFLLAAALLAPQSGALAVLFVLCGLFALFEALRGWCAVRACAIKTPL